MTKNDFLQLKNEVVDFVIEYEFLQRKINYLKYKYILELPDVFKQEIKYSFENNIMIAAVKKLYDGVDKNLIINEINNAKSKIKDNIVGLDKYVLDARKYLSYSDEDIKKMDSDYVLFCQKYHPVVNVDSTDVEKGMYALLARFYTACDVDSFNKLYLEFLPNFKEMDLDVIKYDDYVDYYQQLLSNMKESIKLMKESFPLNCEDKFLSYESITSLIGEKREEVYKLMEMNKAIKKDFLLNFDIEF